MNSKIGSAACLSIFAIASLSLPAFAYKTVPMVGKTRTQNVVASKLTKKSKKISLNEKTTAVISCGKK